MIVTFKASSDVVCQFLALTCERAEPPAYGSTVRGLLWFRTVDPEAISGVLVGAESAIRTLVEVPLGRVRCVDRALSVFGVEPT